MRQILVLVIAGEAVFGLPFIVARVFRPTLLDVFGITNLQLGTAFSLYGVVAMFAYFPGGPLADRFSPRWLLTIALATTACGGIYYSTVPGMSGLTVLFGFWGLSTILLFWAALIRATREWGGESLQGAGFGILDGGRGLFAALLASLTVAVFAALLPDDVASATLEQRTEALRWVILIFTGMTAAVAVLVWFSIPSGEAQESQALENRITLKSIGLVMKNPAVWLQGAIVLCAYTGFKGTDDFALYARDGFGFDEVESARISTLSLWVRPFAALGAGLLADRIRASNAVVICFLAVAVGYLVVALGLLDPSATWMLYITIVTVSAGVFGLRGTYFALFKDARVPTAVTGTAVGLVSVIGFTPDIFIGPIMGYLTDNYAGALGHQYFFGVLSGFAILGLVATLVFKRVTLRSPDEGESHPVA
jgi:nitrate/nitrite transporter NarK